MDARSFFCPDLRALITLVLRVWRSAAWRPRLAEDLILAMEMWVLVPEEGIEPPTKGL
ncbi:hypothetical protein D3C83_300810 [compost metagenome]